jgi:energy-coupling factor transporter ATP-binding protein EcfA2
MRVTRIRATGILSFAGRASGHEFSLTTGDTTVLIGPNGSGKSNLVSLIHLVTGVVGAASERVAPVRPIMNRGATRLDEAGIRLRHHGLPEGEGVEAGIGLELTTPAERELVKTFLRATLVSQLTTNNANAKAGDYWPLVEQIPDGAFEPFFRGELVASHTGIAGTYWRARFDLDDPVDGLQLAWDLWMNSGQLLRADATEARPLHDAWAKLGLTSPLAQTTANQPEGPSDMTSFSFGVMAAEPTESWPTVIVLSGLRPEQLAPAVRRFLAMTGMVVPQGHASIGAAYVWDCLLRDGIRVLDIDAPLGLRGDAGLLAGSWRYSADELAKPAGRSVGELPRRLWELHNGGPEEAIHLQSVKDCFKAIAPGKELCVGGRLVPEETSTASTPLQLVVQNTPAGGMTRFSPPAPVLAVPGASEEPATERRFSLEVDLSVTTGPDRTEPLSAAGSGVAQALVIADALGGCEGRLTIFDEPGVNLHPEWQRLVRAQIDRLASCGDDPSRSAQFLLITHSAALTAPTRANGKSFVLPTRLMLEDRATRAIRPPNANTATKWPVDLQLSPDPWGLLFANGVLLAEGATEVGALPLGYPSKRSEHKESLECRGEGRTKRRALAIEMPGLAHYACSSSSISSKVAGSANEAVKVGGK